MEKVLFKEEQRFRQWWIWLIMVFALLSVIVPLVKAIAEEQARLNSLNNWRLIFYGVLAVSFLITIIVVKLFIRLKTKITYDGIYVAYIPFVRKWKKISIDELTGYELRKYRANLEFGGHGMRRRKMGQAFTISGNIGLLLHLKDGKKLLIGTQKKQAIEYAMVKIIGKEKTMSAAVKNLPKEKSFLGGKTKKFLIIMLMEIVLIIVIFSLMQIFK